MKFKIFVSYSSHDLKSVDEITNEMSGTNCEIFVAEHSILPSQNLSQTIEDAIKKCDLFVLFWGKKTEQSKWVKQEIGYAKALKKRILPLVLNKGIELPGFIQGLKYLKIFQKNAFTTARKVILEIVEEKIENEKLNKQRAKNNIIIFGVTVFLIWAFAGK